MAGLCRNKTGVNLSGVGRVFRQYAVVLSV